MHRIPIVERLDGRRAGELELKESPKWNIDRDQAVDGDGHANYDGYVLSREIEDDDSPVSELETYQFDADTMESYARRW